MEVSKHTIFVQKFETATKLAKECALINRNNAVQRAGNMWQVDCHCTEEEYNQIFETVFGEPYYTEEDDYDWDEMYYDSYSSHHSVLEGGFDEPTMDEWERSGLL